MESSWALLLLLFGDWFVGKGLGKFVTRGRLTRGRVACGSGQMNDDGQAMRARTFPCITTPCSSTSRCLLLRMWLLSGSRGLEMQGPRRTIAVVERPITLRRCFRMRIRDTIWVGCSTSPARSNLIAARPSDPLQRSNKGASGERLAANYL